MNQREKEAILADARAQGIAVRNVTMIGLDERHPGTLPDEFYKSLQRFTNGDLDRMNRQDKMKTLVAAAAKGIVDPSLVSEEELRPGSISDRMCKSLANEMSDAPVKARQSKMDVLVEGAQKGLISLEIVALEESKPGSISNEFVLNLEKELRGQPSNRMRDPYVQASGGYN